MSDNLLDISDSFTWEEGIPKPHWDLINTWAAINLDPDEEATAWTQISRQWLSVLADAFQEDMQLFESGETLLLSSDPPESAGTLLTFIDECKSSICVRLAGVAEYRTPGKLVVVHLPNQDRYYDYIAAYTSEGHHGGSVGMHIREGYPHIALAGTDRWLSEGTLAHELTHAALTHLQLPQWIEEGLAQMFEHDLTGRHLLEVDAEMAAEHKKAWKKRGLDEFWRGEGFSSPGKVQRLSYQLAEILIRLLLEEHQPRWFGFDKSAQRRFFGFLAAARAEDCGTAAAEEHLGVPLSDVASRFLGPGEWAPGW